jgi:sporulation protein YlmC with PRC-barrel domain
MTSQSSSRELILGERVTGTEVFNEAGEHIGELDDLLIHKTSGKVVYALMSFGGFLGMGEKIHPLPWEVLRYDTAKDGYVVPINKEALKNAPSLDLDNIDELGSDTAWNLQLHEYYSPYGAKPYR